MLTLLCCLRTPAFVWSVLIDLTLGVTATALAEARFIYELLWPIIEERCCRAVYAVISGVVVLAAGKKFWLPPLPMIGVWHGYGIAPLFWVSLSPP